MIFQLVIPGGYPIQTPPPVRFPPWQSRPELPVGGILPPNFNAASNPAQNPGVNKVQGKYPDVIFDFIFI